MVTSRLALITPLKRDEKIRQNGGNVTREAGPVKGGTTVIAFVEDPDGYKIELIEEKDAGRGLGN